MKRLSCRFQKGGMGEENGENEGQMPVMTFSVHLSLNVEERRNEAE